MMKRLTLAATLATSLALTACVTGDEAEEQGATGEDIEVTTPAEEDEERFEVDEVDPKVTDETTGERVEDPAMDLSYKWQGTEYSPNGSVVVVAVTNESDAPMPADTLSVKLRYNDGNSMQDARFNPDAEAAGIDIVGVDHPLGPGATTNAKYPFDVSTGNLWDAEFTIGNVTFKGNLNN